MATELTGVFTHLDENGNEIELYPKVKTDTSLTKSGEPADAKTVGDKFAEKSAYLQGKLFDTVDDLLDYATSLLKKTTVAFMPFSLTDVSNVIAPYSSGFITIKYDTCSVVLFRYTNGRIFVNSKVATGNWIGWKTMAFTSELENYIPLSDTNVTLKKGGLLAPNGDIYLKDNSIWVSSWLNTLQAAANKHNSGANISVPTYIDFDEGTDRDTYFKNVLKWICTNYPGVSSRTWMFNCNPNSSGWSAIFIYNTDDVIDGLPRYGSGIYIPLTKGTGEIYTYGCHEGKFVAKTNTPSPQFSLSGTTLTITT